MTTATRSSWYRVRPPQIMRDTYPWNRVWQREVEDGHLSVIVGREPTELANGDRVLLWHLSISHRTNDHPPQPGRYPTWDEIRQARERFVPDEVTVALFLPPKAEYMHHPQDHLPPVGGDRMTIAATRAYALITGVAFVATVFAANWAITRYGAVPVGFGLIAPAGVYFAGLAFSFRDALHEFGGRWAVLAAIAAGAGASALVAPPALVVAVAGRPVSKVLDDGLTIEVTRVATDGTRNACSMLYGACWRAARALGYRRAITYNLDTEGGASLRAAGWVRVASRPARPGWDMPSRRRDNAGYEPADRGLWMVESGVEIARPTVWPEPAEVDQQPDLFAGAVV